MLAVVQHGFWIVWLCSHSYYITLHNHLKYFQIWSIVQRKLVKNSRMVTLGIGHYVMNGNKNIWTMLDIRCNDWKHKGIGTFLEILCKL
jgi:hypothetical protein